MIVHAVVAQLDAWSSFDSRVLRWVLFLHRGSSTMSHRKRLSVTLLVFALGCGGKAEIASNGSSGANASSGGSGSGSSGGSAGSGSFSAGTAAGSESGSAPALMIGELTAQQDVGNPFFQQDFFARFVPEPADAGAADGVGTCAGATQTVGDCCYFPPSPPPGDPPPGSGSAVADQNAGVITLVDTTSRVQVGTFNYDYPDMDFTAAVWQPGDILTVRATGDQVSAFTVSAPALIPPIGQIPSSINLTQDFQITWQPDPNADIMDISISPPSDSGQVNCTLPDANGSVTVAASLFAAFPPGDGGVGVMGVSLVRAAQRDTQTATGTVEFVTQAYSASVQVSVGFDLLVGD